MAGRDNGRRRAGRDRAALRAASPAPRLTARRTALSAQGDRQGGIKVSHTYEGIETMQTLIVGRDITGMGAFA